MIVSYFNIITCEIFCYRHYFKFMKLFVYFNNNKKRKVKFK